MTNKVIQVLCACKIEGKLLLANQKKTLLSTFSSKRRGEMIFSSELKADCLPLELSFL